MPISEFEHRRYEKIINEFCEKQGPPAHLHDKLKWGYQVDPKKQTVVLFEIRPHFQDPELKIESPIAKAKYVKSQNVWKVYWMRANGKWFAYEPYPSARTLEEFLRVVKEDEYRCFFG